MFNECISTCDVDWWYEDETHEKTYVTDEDVTCCECGCTIDAGMPHDYYEGTRPQHADAHPGLTETFHTCQVCMLIWDSVTGGDRQLGDLQELVSSAYGLPLAELPDADTTQDWEDLINQYGFDDAALEAAAQPNGQPKITRVLAALTLLEDFVHPQQLSTIFEWATSVGAAASESAESLQERIEHLSARLEFERTKGEVGASLPGPTVRQEIAALDDEALMFDGFDDAVIGTVYRCGQPMLVAYGYDTCVDVLVRDGLTPEEATEWMTYNVEGGWIGERTPCVVHALENKRL